MTTKTYNYSSSFCLFCRVNIANVKAHLSNEQHIICLDGGHFLQIWWDEDSCFQSHFKIYESGKVLQKGASSRQEAEKVCEKFLEKIKELYPIAALNQFTHLTMLAVYPMGCRVSMFHLASKYPEEHIQYEPEISAGCTWKKWLEVDGCVKKYTVRVYSTGKLTMMGKHTEDEADKVFKIFAGLIKSFDCIAVG